MTPKERNVKYRAAHPEKIAAYNLAHSVTLIGRYSRAKSNAARRKTNWSPGGKPKPISWSLTFDQWSKIATAPCLYCDRPSYGTGSWCDRIDNDSGYSADNVVPCCPFCNTLRRNQLTHSEMLLLRPALIQIRVARGG